MTKIDKFSESANDSLQISASANEKGIQIFNNQEFGNVRTTLLNGEVVFAATDVARCLGYANPQKAIRDHCKDKGVNEIDTPTNGGIQKMKYITKGNVIRLVANSTLPQAERVESWIFDEVIPQVLEHGGYMLTKEDETTEELLARAYMIAQETLKRKEKRLLEAESKIKEDAPKVEYFNGLIERGNNLNFRDTAKLLGIGEKAFIFMLIDNKYIYRDAKGKLKPIAKYVDKYFVLKEWNREENGKAGTQTLITVKGREYFKKIVDDILSEKQ